MNCAEVVAVDAQYQRSNRCYRWCCSCCMHGTDSGVNWNRRAVQNAHRRHRSNNIGNFLSAIGSSQLDHFAANLSCPFRDCLPIVTRRQNGPCPGLGGRLVREAVCHRDVVRCRAVS